jgi:cytochrome P450
VFSRPREFNLDRTESRHLAFGHGPHFCLGASLAVLQGETVLAALATRAPGFRITDGEIRRRDEMAFHSAASLNMDLPTPANAAMAVTHAAAPMQCPHLAAGEQP